MVRMNDKIGKFTRDIKILATPQAIQERRAIELQEAIAEAEPDEQFDMVITFLRQILSALEVVHRMGICHGDIKSANILVLPEYNIAKLADFGFGLLPGENRSRSEYPWPCTRWQLAAAAGKTLDAAPHRALLRWRRPD